MGTLFALRIVLVRLKEVVDIAGVYDKSQVLHSSLDTHLLSATNTTPLNYVGVDTLGFTVILEKKSCRSFFSTHVCEPRSVQATVPFVTALYQRICQPETMQDCHSLVKVLHEIDKHVRE